MLSWWAGVPGGCLLCFNRAACARITGHGMDSRPAMAIFELLDYIVNEVRAGGTWPRHLRIVSALNAVYTASWSLERELNLSSSAPLLQPPPKLPNVFTADFQEFVTKWWAGGGSRSSSICCYSGREAEERLPKKSQYRTAFHLPFSLDYICVLVYLVGKTIYNFFKPMFKNAWKRESTDICIRHQILHRKQHG